MTHRGGFVEHNRLCTPIVHLGHQQHRDRPEVPREPIVDVRGVSALHDRVYHLGKAPVSSLFRLATPADVTHCPLPAYEVRLAVPDALGCEDRDDRAAGVVLRGDLPAVDDEHDECPLA